jgi:hypothetical protein
LCFGLALRRAAALARLRLAASAFFRRPAARWRRLKSPGLLAHACVSGLAQGLPHRGHFTDAENFGLILVRLRPRPAHTWLTGLV